MVPVPKSGDLSGLQLIVEGGGIYIWVLGPKVVEETIAVVNGGEEHRVEW